jgi:hypothetical protein
VGTLKDEGKGKREEGKGDEGEEETPPPDALPAVESGANLSPPKGRPGKATRAWRWWVGVLLLLLLMALPPVLQWQQGELKKTRSLNNMRRLATGLLLYAQDWDGRLMPPATRLPDSSWLTWPQLLDAYVKPAEAFANPANPRGDSPPRHPKEDYPIRAGYALNRRFWNTFAPGPFPLENLELAEQTVLLVEAGPMWNDPKSPSRTSNTALLDYGDTNDRVDGFCPYPSPHRGKMTIVAADGHADTIEIKHYGSENGPHDPLYGRLGSNFYNWNGGHPNGETDTPPRE